MYQKTHGNGVVRTSNGAFIPADEGNRDYQEYLEWLDEGNTPEPPEDSSSEIKAREARAKRDRLMEKFEWRLERYRRQEFLGETPIDNLGTLHRYMRDLADVPQQTGFPDEVTWPDKPAEGS